MSTLLDIAPQFDEVDVAGVLLRVYGLSAAAIASLLFRFPELREVFASGIASITPETIGRIGNDACGAIIAHAIRQGDDPAQEEAARGLGLHWQAAILKPCYDRTFPKGVEDFLTTLGLAAPGADDEAAVQKAS